MERVMQANIDVLTAMNVADLQKSFKVDQRPLLRQIVAVLGGRQPGVWRVVWRPATTWLVSKA
jgi:hypothetical protein